MIAKKTKATKVQLTFIVEAALKRGKRREGVGWAWEKLEYLRPNVGG